jgi:hypothetical protein
MWIMNMVEEMQQKRERISAMVLKMKLWGFVRIMCRKDEWNSECVQASHCGANTNEAQIECQQATQWWGQVIEYAGENVSNKTQILLICVICEVCERCSVLPLKVEQGWTVHNCCSFPALFVHKSLKGGEEKEENKGKEREGRMGAPWQSWQVKWAGTEPLDFFYIHSNQSFTKSWKTKNGKELFMLTLSNTKDIYFTEILHRRERLWP